MNNRNERLAFSLVVLIVAAAVALPLAGWLLQPQAPLLHARMAEAGGWTPESLSAEVGKPLHLRLTSDDVLHSFALGQSEASPVDVKPGEVSEVTLTFDRPGKYTFYCTRWCSINHWRMRGVIEVTDPAGASGPAVQEGVTPPLYVTLGLDLDAAHSLDTQHPNAPLPVVKPSSALGQALGISIAKKLAAREYYRSHSPAEAFETLQAEPALKGLPAQDLWNLVALAWSNNITPQSLENGRRLYATNCAACHGQAGAGDGVFAAQLAKPARAGHESMAAGEMTQRPADFTASGRMLAVSPAHLQGKIIRGGMGTGMPYWGPIFTEEQTWDLVAYLWSFQFNLEVKP